MLASDYLRWFQLSAEDERIYSLLLPAEHPLLDALEFIPWDDFVPELESYYCPGMGQPAYPPLIMFKLEFLRYFCRLSDREVITRAHSDVLFRWFLQIPIARRLPDPSLLTKFRGRLGAEGFKRLFDQLVAAARHAGLVRDHLRLKDATHVIANIAVPTTRRLLAQLRERMLAVMGKFDPEAATGFRIEIERIRFETATADDAIKLQARLDLIGDMLGWITEQPPPLSETDNQRWQQLQTVRQLAEKICSDLHHPNQGHRTRSVVDPDARRGKHGEFFDGYLLDVMMDADSDLITAVDVLAADGDEAKDAIDLVQSEHQVHSNQIERLSIDGAGFNGELLRELENPAGLAVDVITPPRDFHGSDGFSSTMFELSADGLSITCPAGQTSTAHPTVRPTTTLFRFLRTQCRDCPLIAECCPNPKPGRRTGRSVSKSHYEVEYERARQKSQTAEYAEVRQRHRAIERKLSEIVRYHGGRRAKYWELAKVQAQQYMTCFAVNVKRISQIFRTSALAATG